MYFVFPYFKMYYIFQIIYNRTKIQARQNYYLLFSFSSQMIFLLWTYSRVFYNVSEWMSESSTTITNYAPAIRHTWLYGTYLWYITWHDTSSSFQPSPFTCPYLKKHYKITLTPNNARCKLFFLCLYCRLIGSSILPHHVGITKARRCIWRDRIRRICSLRAPREEGICSNRRIP